MVIDFVCLLFIKLFVAKSPNMWLRPQAVLRMFLFWFLRMCVCGFDVGLF